MTEPLTADQIVSEVLRIEDHVAAESKRFSEYLAPSKARVEELKNRLLSMLNEQGCDSFKTEHGTAYKSTLMNLKVEDREKFLDLCNEQWDDFGSEALLVSAQKDAVKHWMDTHGGQPPIGTSISFFTRVNIRRS